MEKVLLKCGHNNNATRHNKDGTTHPSCVICDCDEIIECPDLATRQAKCTYYGKKNYKNECHSCKHGGGFCTCIQTSNLELAFFKYHFNEEHDEFYCGCHGWD